MVPTPRAERIRPRVARLLDEARGILSEEGPFEPAALQRDFRIASTDYAELLVVRSLSDALAIDAPGVDLRSLRVHGDLVDELRAGTVDVGVGVISDPPPDVRCEPLFDEQFVCLLRKGHPALKRKLTLERYVKLGHVLVSPGGTPLGVVDRVLARRGLERRVARTVASFLVAPRLVADSDFVLTIAKRVACLLAGPLELAVRPPPLELSGFELKMVWHRRNDDDPAHAWLRERMRRSAS
jgi:DNA-binding transcriptional LysR family regulator